MAQTPCKNCLKGTVTIPRPSFLVVALRDALEWRGDVEQPTKHMKINRRIPWPRSWKELTEADGLACAEQLMFDQNDGTIHLIEAHETFNGRVLTDEEYSDIVGPAWTAAPARGQLIVEKMISRKKAMRWLLDRFLCVNCLNWEPLGEDTFRLTLKLPRRTQ
jgi:hypothetical protein